MPLDLASYLARVAAGRGGAPIFLIGTDMRVRIEGGLAVVATERTFRNAEAVPIEATITFPVPVHAVLFDLFAEIDGRRLQAQTRRRQAARATYETALDRGKAAVLHEELLRGIHMLSVGQVGPGKEVTVTASWALPLSAAGDEALSLTIPTTCGDVYGQSPLPASDELTRDPCVVQEATLAVRCERGTVELRGGGLREGRARVRLDHPIEIRVTGAEMRPLGGVAADGRAVSLAIERLPAAEGNLDAAILVDRSGSMAAPAFVPVLRGQRGVSKHELLVRGLGEAAASLRGADRLRLWQFDDDAQFIAETLGAGFAEAVARLGGPRGGTRIGAAVAAVLAASPTRDILLVTDGQSYALDVQACARSGRRFSVLLVGEGALEAHVGHLAALTGGEIFLATDDADAAVQRALASMRRPHVVAAPITGAPMSAEACLGGMWVRTEWRTGVADAEADGMARAVAAVAASLAMPRMEEAEAAALAEAEGLVCHLTSLVLVDEAGAAVQGLPAQWKVPLMAARAQFPGVLFSCCMRRFADDDEDIGLRVAAPSRVPTPDVPSVASRRALYSIVHDIPSPVCVPSFLRRTDWMAEPERLRRGDFAGVPESFRAEAEALAARPEVIALAQNLGEPPLLVALALIALGMKQNRAAARFARAILGNADAALLAAAKVVVGV